MMKKIIPLFTTLLLLGWSMNAWSFACKTATGATIPIGGGSANVYVNLTPAVNVGQNLVVDLSTQIFAITTIRKRSLTTSPCSADPPTAACCRVSPAP